MQLGSKAAVHYLVLPTFRTSEPADGQGFQASVRCLRSIWDEVTNVPSEPLTRGEELRPFPTDFDKLRLGNQSMDANRPEIEAYWGGAFKEADPHSGVRESICSLIVDHDTLGLLVVRILDKSDAGPAAWRRLEADWERLRETCSSSAGPESATYGCSAYLGLAPTAVWHIKPLVHDFVGASGTGPLELAASHVSLWRLPALQRRRMEPRFVAVASDANERALDDWSWNLQMVGRPWFWDYATESAKLRYVNDVLLDLFDRERESRQQLRAKVDELLEVLVTHDSGSDTGQEAEQLGQGLKALAQPGDRVTDQFWYLNELELTAQVAQTNLVALIQNQLPTTTKSMPPATPFDAERRLGDWLTVQVKIERDYMKAVLDRAEKLAERARGVVDANRTTSATRLEASVATFTVITTTFLTTLTAISILPESHRNDLPLVAMFGAVVAALTLYIGFRVVRIESGKRQFDYVVAVGAGLCVGLGLPWLLGRRIDWDIGSAVWFLVSSVAGIVGAIGLYRLVNAIASRQEDAK